MKWLIKEKETNLLSSPCSKIPLLQYFDYPHGWFESTKLRSPTFAECNIFCPFLSFVALAGNDFQLIRLTNFSPVLHFIQKQVIRFRLQSKWLVSIWNTTLDWNNLNYFLIFWILPSTKKHYDVVNNRTNTALTINCLGLFYFSLQVPFFLTVKIFLNFLTKIWIFVNNLNF